MKIQERKWSYIECQTKTREYRKRGGGEQKKQNRPKNGKQLQIWEMLSNYINNHFNANGLNKTIKRQSLSVKTKHKYTRNKYMLYIRNLL